MFHREQSEAGPGLHAPPRSKPLRFRHSGSPQRHRLGWACVLCSSQVRAAQVMRCLASANVVTYRLPATRLSGCKTGAPSQADVDRPDPQEVLVSKEGCLQFYTPALRSGDKLCPCLTWRPTHHIFGCDLQWKLNCPSQISSIGQTKPNCVMSSKVIWKCFVNLLPFCMIEQVIVWGDRLRWPIN